MIGEVLSNKYELTRLLGAGGVGEVYEALDREAGRSVVVKVLHDRYADRLQELRERFESARYAEALRQPGICAVTELCEAEDGRPCLVTPLLRGRSLAAELEATEGRFPADRAIDIVYQVASTLQQAHDAGVAHLALKPSSLFLTALGTRQDFVKILDFGVAAALVEPDQSEESLAGAWSAMGRPTFLSPEQAAGAGAVDHRADLYAMTAILYALLTGRPPFEVPDPDALRALILEGDVPLPGSLNPDISPALERVILKGMSRNPEDRYSSARQLKHALLKRVRLSSLRLPQYLTRLGFTGELPVFDPTELGSLEAHALDPAAPPSRLPLNAVGIAVVSAIVIAVIFASTSC